MSQYGLPKIGETVDNRYRLERAIGRGGAASVYGARDLTDGRLVALKLLDPITQDETRARRRFQREARIAAGFHHPNAVEIYAYGVDGELMYLAMECLAGETLAQRLRRGAALAMSEIVGFGHVVAGLLVETHPLPLVHRDLKPDNIFLVPDDRHLVVLDFGLAYIEGDNSLGRVTTRSKVVGTAKYMAPEQARAGEIGPPADIYALGCILFELTAGRPPFSGRGLEVLTRHMYLPAPPLVARPGLTAPDGFAYLVKFMLAKQPQDRPTAVESRDALLQMGAAPICG